MTQPDVPVSVRLEVVAGALFRGDWRSATDELQRGGDAEGDGDLVKVMTGLRRIANCQRLQCAFGDARAALRELDCATETLVRLGARTGEGGGLRIPAEPPRDLPVRHLVWATTRLVERERADILALRLIFGDITRGSRELTYACAEHLTWVEFDPFTVSVHEHDQELSGLDDAAYLRFRIANPHDISARATSLRRLADVRKGSVASRTWHRMGGYGAVRHGALLVLAGEQLTRGRADLPVRLGRVRAVQYAKGFHKDTAA
jgi:hypothetical protein